ALVEVEDAHVGPAETPVDLHRRAPGTGREPAVLAALVVEAADAQTVLQVIAPVARTVDEMVGVEVSPRRAPGGHAPPAVADVNLVVATSVRAQGTSRRRVPGADEVLDEGQESDPGWDAPAALEEGASGGDGRLRRIVRPGLVPGNPTHDPGDRVPVALDRR